MLGLKLIHVSERGAWSYRSITVSHRCAILQQSSVLRSQATRSAKDNKRGQASRPIKINRVFYCESQSYLLRGGHRYGWNTRQNVSYRVYPICTRIRQNDSIYQYPHWIATGVKKEHPYRSRCENLKKTYQTENNYINADVVVADNDVSDGGVVVVVDDKRFP